MASMHSPSIQAEVSEDRRWPTERRPVDLDTRPSLGKRASRTLARILITFVATLERLHRCHRCHSGKF
jgi:hypothetical protein